MTDSGEFLTTPLSATNLPRRSVSALEAVNIIEIGQIISESEIILPGTIFIQDALRREIVSCLRRIARRFGYQLSGSVMCVGFIMPPTGPTAVAWKQQRTAKPAGTGQVSVTAATRYLTRIAQRLGLTDFHELAELSDAELSGYRRIGPVTIRQIRQRFDVLGQPAAVRQDAAANLKRPEEDKIGALPENLSGIAAPETGSARQQNTPVVTPPVVTPSLATPPVVTPSLATPSVDTPSGDTPPPRTMPAARPAKGRDKSVAPLIEAKETWLPPETGITSRRVPILEAIAQTELKDLALPSAAKKDIKTLHVEKLGQLVFDPRCQSLLKRHQNDFRKALSPFGIAPEKTPPYDFKPRRLSVEQFKWLGYSITHFKLDSITERGLKRAHIGSVFDLTQTDEGYLMIKARISPESVERLRTILAQVGLKMNMSFLGFDRFDVPRQPAGGGQGRARGR